MTRHDIRQLARSLALLSQLGLTVVVAILIGVAIGVSLEGVLGAAGPLLGIFMGIGGAGVGASRLVAEVFPAARSKGRLAAEAGRREMETCEKKDSKTSSPP